MSNAGNTADFSNYYSQMLRHSAPSLPATQVPSQASPQGSPLAPTPGVAPTLQRRETLVGGYILNAAGTEGQAKSPNHTRGGLGGRSVSVATGPGTGKDRESAPPGHPLASPSPSSSSPPPSPSPLSSPSKAKGNNAATSETHIPTQTQMQTQTQTQTHTPDPAHQQYLRSFHFTPEFYDHPSLGRDVGPTDFVQLQLLGKGDFGRVYLVKEKASGVLYAMKVLDKKEVIKRDKVHRVLAEQHVLKCVNHPFIVTLYHSFQSEDKLFFVITYCGGGAFYKMISTQPNRRLPEHIVKFYAAEVLLALEYLHLMGFIYRDLKPENLLLHSSGHLKIADFDLSKEFDNQYEGPSVCMNPKKLNGPIVNTRISLMKTESFVGTVEYIAPEVLSGTGQDASLDWWTFGVFIYELLFGTTPFKGSSQDDTFSHILTDKVQFPADVSVSEDGKKLIRKLLRRDTKQRLGYRYDASEIKEHSFFKDINWALIRNSSPVLQPQFSHALDTSHFTSIVDDMGVNLSKEKKLEDRMDPTGFFRNFTYHRPAACNTYSDTAPFHVTN